MINQESNQIKIENGKCVQCTVRSGSGQQILKNGWKYSKGDTSTIVHYKFADYIKSILSQRILPLASRYSSST